ncbi:UNVERIFIED_CONTAM: hypothetical protein GTU68_028121, partial [Idotea baltica]|nr:hypothetical protein [Idotea baltica]
ENKHLIAIVEDDDAVRSSLVLNLELHNFEIITAADGELGVELIESKNPDLVIMDVMMPNKDGLQVVRELRAKNNPVPIIMLTARNQEVDKVLGLELGADDYLAKPFGMPELIARVKAILRRVVKNTEEINTIEFDDVVIDFRAYQAKKAEAPLELSAREYRLLRYLVAKKGDVVTRDELLDEVWGYNSYPSTRTVDNHIARLRQKIEKDANSPEHILTVHGVGYKFTG